MAAPASDAPRVRVAALIPLADGIVLVRHRKAGRSYHLLPGGGVRRGETLAQALQREVSEETGARCHVVRPLFISDTIAPDGTRHTVNITFLCRTDDPVRQTGLDDRVKAVDVVALETLPSLDLRPPIATAIQQAAGVGFNQAPAAYLGSLWTDETDDLADGRGHDTATT